MKKVQKALHKSCVTFFLYGVLLLSTDHDALFVMQFSKYVEAVYMLLFYLKCALAIHSKI